MSLNQGYMAGPEVLADQKRLIRPTFLGKADMVKKYQGFEVPLLDHCVLLLISTFTIRRDIRETC